MVPVLYTDTTDSWRLTVRTQRAAIAAAGTVVELSVAMLATFFWNFSPDGIVKSMLFVLATTSWVTGLLINLNPLLRFDGYYVLSDWLGVPNLQSRAFAVGRWKLREWLFAWGDGPPEHMPPHRQSVLISYAWAVGFYRAIVFLGIAILVYYFFSRFWASSSLSLKSVGFWYGRCMRKCRSGGNVGQPWSNPGGGLASESCSWGVCW